MTSCDPKLLAHPDRPIFR